MEEIWKDVVGYEGLYQVSSLGRVKSLERLVKNDNKGGFRLIKEKVLSLCSSGRQYYYVSLRKNSLPKKVYVHRLVAEAFLPNPENKPCVDHIDTNRTNNIVVFNDDGSIDNTRTNLRWVTHKENTRNPISFGKMMNAFKDKDFLKRRAFAKVGKGGKTAPKHVFMYSKDGVFIRDFVSITEAAKEMGVTDGNICVAVDSPTRSACGFKWYSKRIEPTQ